MMCYGEGILNKEGVPSFYLFVYRFSHCVFFMLKHHKQQSSVRRALKISYNVCRTELVNRRDIGDRLFGGVILYGLKLSKAP